MAVRARGENSGIVRQSEAAKHVSCSTCGESVERKGLLDPRATMVVHCDGTALAYGCLIQGPHHSSLFWPRCWKCAGPMGCALCVPGMAFDPETRSWANADLVCKRCRVKATLESLLNGGPISSHFMRQGNDRLEWGTVEKPTPNLGEYPAAWVRAYSERCYALGIDPDEGDTGAWRECRTVFDGFRIAPISKPKGRYALLREKNQQAKEAAEKAEQFQATEGDLPEGCWDEQSNAPAAGLGARGSCE